MAGTRPRATRDLTPIPTDFPNTNRLGDSSLFRTVLGGTPKSTFARWLAADLLPAPTRICGLNMHVVGFEQIELHRRARNLVAHFIARRFPAEDAFIFMTMSASDFEQVYGMLPGPDSMLFGVIDAPQMRGIIPVLEGLASWCSKLPSDLSNPIDARNA